MLKCIQSSVKNLKIKQVRQSFLAHFMFSRKTARYLSG